MPFVDYMIQRGNIHKLKDKININVLYPYNLYLLPRRLRPTAFHFLFNRWFLLFFLLHFSKIFYQFRVARTTRAIINNNNKYFFIFVVPFSVYYVISGPLKNAKYYSLQPLCILKNIETFVWEWINFTWKKRTCSC